MKKLLIILILLTLPQISHAGWFGFTWGAEPKTSSFDAPVTFGATTLFPSGGGTGKGTATAGDVGLCLKVLDDSPFQYEFATCGSGGGSDFPFTPVAGGNATTSLLYFYNGVFTLGSSTIQFASSTAVSTGYASSTLYFGADLVDCDDPTNSKLLWSNTGRFSCGSDQTGAGGTIDGLGLAGMMTSWVDGNTIQSTSTIVGAQIIATSTATSSLPRLLSTGGAFTWLCLDSCRTTWPVDTDTTLAWPWSPTTNYAVATNATTGISWWQNGIQASSTSQLVYASTTAITAQSANILRLDNLASAGFVKTSAIGTLSVDTATYESGLTAGDGLTRTVNDFDCDTSDTSTFGCLTDTDWDTFNNKVPTTITLTAGNGLTGGGDLSANRTFTVGVENGLAVSADAVGLDLTGYPVNNLILTYNGTRIIATGTPSLTAGYFIATTTSTSTLPQLDVVGIQASTYQQFDNLTSALVLTGTTGITAEYAGATCTGQFIRVLSALGAPTCATVGSADVDLADLTATNGSLTFSGAYDGQTARTVGLNMANANIWTALQTFTSASSTSFSSLHGVFVGSTATTSIVGNLGTSTFSSFISAVAASTTATSTMAGINLPFGGCFAVAGACITGGVGGSGTVNAGVLGQLSWYASSGTAVSGSSTDSLTMGKYNATSTTATSTFTNAVNIGTSTQTSAKLTAGSIVVPMEVLATSTSMTVNPNLSNSQFFRRGTATITLTFPATGAYIGQRIDFKTCTGLVASGALTLVSVRFAGGIHPSFTTTANQCDRFSVQYSVGTSSPTWDMVGMQSGYQ